MPVAGGQVAPKGGKTPRSKRLNLVLVVTIVLIAVGSLMALQLSSGTALGDASGVARITDGDGNVYELPLDTDGTKIITTSLGTNVVEVKDGRVRVRVADCPNQDCVNQGWIDSSSQQIVCLPHKLYVDVIGGQRSDVDVVGR